MKREMGIGAAAAATVLAMTLGVAGARAADASVSVDLASAYVFRGLTLNDGLVVQPGLAVSGLPFDLGVWGNLDIDDYDGGLKDGQFSELDIYGSYALPVEGVDASIGYTEYTYPSSGGDADREVSLSVGFRTLLAPSLTLYYGVDGVIEETLYIEAGAGHRFALSAALGGEVSAMVAYLAPDVGDGGFSHFTVGAGLSHGVFSAALTYVGRIDDDVLPDVGDGGAYDVELYGSLGFAYEF